MVDYKQIIRVPDKVTRHFFELPCVLGADKFSIDNTTSYTVDAKNTSGSTALKAYPGDYLCEKEDGSWVIVRDFEKEWAFE